MLDFKKITVRSISPKQTYDLLLNVHYAKRIPPIQYAYGAYDQANTLLGVVTYGTPSSSTLRNGVCGSMFGHYVLELNRLCLGTNHPNLASFLVARSIKLLAKSGPRILVSFADISQAHTGIVYQASGFMYCGLSAKRTDWKIRGLEHLHSQTITDMVRGAKPRTKALRDKFGSDFYLQDRPRKHRYVKFVGPEHKTRKFKASLLYPQESYPKKEALVLCQ